MNYKSIAKEDPTRHGRFLRLERNFSLRQEVRQRPDNALASSGGFALSQDNSSLTADELGAAAI